MTLQCFPTEGERDGLTRKGDTERRRRGKESRGAGAPSKTLSYDGKEAKPVYHPTLLALFERFSSARNSAGELCQDTVNKSF